MSRGVVLALAGSTGLGVATAAALNPGQLLPWPGTVALLIASAALLALGLLTD